MEGKGKWIPGKRIPMTNKHEWNDNISDLSSMRLTKQEQAKKLLSRQSHNLAIAKAELIDRNLQSGSPRSFSPSLSSKLRTSDSKTVEDALADGSAAIALAQKIRNDDLADQFSKVENYFRSQIHSQDRFESQKCYSYDEPDKREQNQIIYNTSHLHHQNPQSIQLEGKDHSSLPLLTNARLHDDDKGNEADEEEDKNQIVQRSFMDSSKDPTAYPLSPQGWQNLNNTIQLVVKTCEALWQQLEEERMTRQRLHFQLQEQRSVITTLTAELLQIQEHQELILKELHASRSSSVPYQSARSFPYDFSQQQQRQQGQHQQQRFQPPLKGLPASRLLADRLPARTLAFSDSSIDAKQQRKKPGEVENFDFGSSPFLGSDHPYRLSHQGKSKSVTQLNTEHDLENTIQDSIRYNNSGVDLLHDASIIDLLRNYRLSEV